MMRRQLGLLVGLAGLVLACSDGSSVVGGPSDAASGDLGVADVGFAIDMPDVPDVPAAPDVPDVSVDVPFHCAADAECVGHAEGALCEANTGRCVQCRASNDTCPAGQYCVGASSTCAPGCRNDDACRATSTDGGVLSAAGRCDLTTRVCVACLGNDDCPLGNLCVGSVCVTGCSATRGCPTDEACCAGACVNIRSNVASCGGCDTRCALPNAALACVDGACAIARCTSPFDDCDRAAANGCEVDIRSTVAHCGGCGRECAARANAVASCTGGDCAYACVAGFGDCNGDPADGCEVDTRVTTAHCGRCGNVCALPNATAACAGGACAVASCATGFADCDGSPINGCEVDTRSDLDHCGACGRLCAARPSSTPGCALGVCSLTCLAGRADCDGDATNGCESALGTSNAHCGTCGHACLAGAPCTAGACVLGPYGTGLDVAFTPMSGTVTINTVRSPAAAAIGSTAVDLSNPTGFGVGQMVFLHQTQGVGAGNWEVRQIVAVMGARITVEASLSAGYDSTGTNRAQAVVMPQYTTVAINGATVVAPAWDGNTGGILAFVARDSVRVMSGAITMSERGFRGHARVNTSFRPGEQGEGTLGYGVQNTVANGNGGGGGGRTACECCWAGGGGGGGHATGGLAGSAGGAVCQPGGNAGAAVGTAAQTTMFLGGAGANGGSDEDGYGSAGANGAGLIYIASPAISIEGTSAIRASGQTGQNEFNYAGCGSGGGGGGAGGAIYLRVESANLGLGLVTTSGGVGGDDPGNCGTPGGNGSVGRITLRGSSTTSGTTTPAFTAVP